MENITGYSNKRLTIKDWVVRDRPREKYVANGPNSLSDAELLSILLRTGSAQDSAVELSRKMLAVSGNSLNRLSEMSLTELTSVKGIGKTKAITLLAAFELNRRLTSEKVEEKQEIKSCYDVLLLMQDKIAFLKHEEFWVIYLDASNNILKTKQISKGGISATAVDVRIILREALQHQATGLIICHNHPSGKLQPSMADRKITVKLKESSAIMDVSLLDHVIVNRSDYFSFVENGLL